MQRREFVQTGLTMAAFSLYPVCAGSCSAGGNGAGAPDIPAEAMTREGGILTIDLGKAGFLQSPEAIGRTEVELSPDEKLRILVVHHPEGRYSAVENKCTHAGMRLSFRPDFKGEGPLLRCNSFGHSRFSLQGDVLKGPAKNPLRVFAVELHEESLRIDLSA